MISVVVACYRDAGSVREMYRRLVAVLSDITPRYEILFVNDDSPDNAEELLEAIAANDDRVTVISHSRNFGSQMAFTSGMAQAIGDGVVLMDGDLQDPPEVIPELAGKWVEGYDVVYGVRVSRRESRVMEATRKAFYRLYRRLSYLEMPLDAGDFSIMSRRVVDNLLRMPERDRFLRGLRSWVGFRQTGVPYVRAERFAGESTNSFLDNIRWAKRGIFSFSYQPLEAISLLAFLVTVFTGAAMVFYVATYLFVPDAPRGFLTLLIAVLFLGAVQLFSLSVVAEYIGRVFEEVKQRPRFIVRGIVNDHKQAAARSGNQAGGVSSTGCCPDASSARASSEHNDGAGGLSEGR